MEQHMQQPPRLKPPAPVEAQQSSAMRVLEKIARQRWITVGAIVFLGGAGLLAADSVAEVLVGKFQRIDDDD